MLSFSKMTGSETISVVIPTLDEEAAIAGAIESVRSEGECEIVVADGGSTDRTLEIAERLAHRVLSCPKGRGVQLNAGADASTGEILIFMHADSRLPEGAFRLVRAALQEDGVSAGAFDLRVGHDASWARVVEALANLRSRLTRVPFGDQGLFMRRGVYRASGGYAPLPIMEDVEIAGRLGRMGKIIFLKDRMTSSARRWLGGGVIMTTLRGWALLFSYLVLRLSPERLVRFYGDSR